MDTERRSETRLSPHRPSRALVALGEHEERLEPILDVSSQGVRILLRKRKKLPEVGQKLPRVRLFTQGECTLDVPGVVRDVLEEKDGYSVGIQLIGGTPQTEPQTTITEELSIADALSNLVAFRCEGQLTRPEASSTDPRPIVSFERALVKERQIRLKLESDIDPMPKAGESYAVLVSLFGKQLLLDAMLDSIEDNAIRMRWPASIRVIPERSEGRLRKLPEGVHMSAMLPLQSTQSPREVCDLSARGLAFLAHEDDIVMLGMTLPAVELTLPGDTIRSRGIIRNVRNQEDGSRTVGVEFTMLSHHQQNLLATFVDSQLHPSVRAPAVEDLANLWPLYDALELFVRKHAALSPAMGRMDATRRTLFGRGDDVWLSNIASRDNIPEGCAELCQSFHRTWTLQHAGLLTDSRVTLDHLLVPLLESATRRDDVEHLHALLPAAQTLPDIGSSHLICRPRTLLASTAQSALQASDDVRDLSAEDQSWVAKSIEQRLDPLERDALNLGKSSMQLEEIGRRYRTLGLERKRAVRTLLGVSEPAGFSTIEHTSPGVNFSGTLDLIRVYPRAASGDARDNALQVLTSDAIRKQQHSGKNPSLVLVDPTDEAALQPLGLQTVGTFVEVFAKKNAALQLVNLVTLLKQIGG